MTKANQETIRLYLDAANKELKGAQHNIDGGYYGIAVSRAYYAFLYTASALLLTRDIVRFKHSAVLSAFREQFVKTGLVQKEYSDAFGEAFDLRQTADYDMVTAAEPEQAVAVLKNAQGFVARISSYLEEGGYR